jgi:hypothetical protein
MKYLFLLLSLSLYSGKIFAEEFPAPYAIEASEIMEFTVDKEGVYKIKVTVPKNQTPVIKVYNLPVGAVLAADGSKITWKPKLEDSKDPKNPKSKSRQYEIKINLSTLEDPKIVLTVNRIFIVNAKPEKKK